MPAKTEKTRKGNNKRERLQALLLVAAAVILAALAAIGSVLPDLLAPAGRGGTDTFFMLNASLENPGYLRELDGRLTRKNAHDVLHDTPSVHAHRLKRGGGAVFAYRWFSEGDPYAVDDEGFEKITIWLPEFPSESVSTIDLSDREAVIAVYTEGGSAWPWSACSGYLNAGHLVIREKGNAFLVALEGTLSPTASLRVRDLCTPKTVAKEFEATELKFDELTTWLGKRGRHPYDESYRDETFR